MENEVTRRIKLLEYKVELLSMFAELKSPFDFLLESNITKEEETCIFNLIDKYSENPFEYNRHQFEKEMANINSVFELNTLLSESILEGAASYYDLEERKILFIHLYGSMPKFKNTFPEIKRIKQKHS